MSSDHVSVKIPPLAADEDGSEGGTRGLVWSGAVEVSPVQPKVRPPSLPVLLRHLRDLQKLFAVRGFLAKQKWVPAVRTARSAASLLGWAVVPGEAGRAGRTCLVSPSQGDTGSGLVKGRQCFSPEVSLGKQTNCFFPSEEKAFFSSLIFFFLIHLFLTLKTNPVLCYPRRKSESSSLPQRPALDAFIHCSPSSTSTFLLRHWVLAGSASAYPGAPAGFLCLSLFFF